MKVYRVEYESQNYNESKTIHLLANNVREALNKANSFVEKNGKKKDGFYYVGGRILISSITCLAEIDG